MVQVQVTRVVEQVVITSEPIIVTATPWPATATTTATLAPTLQLTITGTPTAVVMSKYYLPYIQRLYMSPEYWILPVMVDKEVPYP